MFFPVFIYFGFLGICILIINKIYPLAAVIHTDACYTSFSAAFASFLLYVMDLSYLLLFEVFLIDEGFIKFNFDKLRCFSF